MSEEKVQPNSIVKEMEESYPEMTKEFKRILKEEYELWCHKMSNYGPDNIALGTTLQKEEDIKISIMGIFFRMNDKINRLKNLVVKRRPDNVGETVEDTLRDLSVYGIIAQIVKNGKWGK